MASSTDTAGGTKRALSEGPAEAAPCKYLEGAFWLFLGTHREAISKEIGSDEPLRIAKEAFERWKAVPAKETVQLKVTALAIETALAGSAVAVHPAAADTGHSGAESAKKAKTASATTPVKSAGKSPSGYSIFLKENRAAIEAELGTRNCVLVSQEVSRRWKALPAEDRARFESPAAEPKTSTAAPKLEENGRSSPSKNGATEDGCESVGSAPALEGKTTESASVIDARALLSDEDTPLLALASALTSVPTTVTAEEKPKKEATSLPKADSQQAVAEVPVVRPAADKPKKPKPAVDKPKKESASSPKAEAQEAAAEEAKAKSKKSKKSKDVKFPQATKEFKATVLAAVQGYLEKHSDDWSRSTLQSDLAEEHGWEYDKYLDFAIKDAIKTCGHEGLGAGVKKACTRI